MADNSNKSDTVQPVASGRRLLAATVLVPPSIGEHLNTDAMAVLAVIRHEAAATGKCTLPVARIAERANVGRAKVRAVIKLAERLEINHPTPTLASQNSRSLKSNRMRQNLP